MIKEVKTRLLAVDKNEKPGMSGFRLAPSEVVFSG
jgi:hypothetical protein